MRFWFREIAGWLLVVLGVMIFLLVFAFLQAKGFVEAAVLGVVGVFIFRGGVHLLKVAVAARICQQAQDRLYPAPPTTPVNRPALPPRSSGARG
jgi:hypothetical protein